MTAFVLHSRAMSGVRLRRQRGVALVVSLILLLVATIIGLAASRGTLLQERMSANSFDRSLAFQRAESALRAAEAAITTNYLITALGGEDCSAVGCALVPTETWSGGTNTTWKDVATVYDVNDSNTPGIPQFYIQYMGAGSADDENGTKQNAETGNYGAGTAPNNVAYYRVTGRSSNPNALGGRSIVVLQTTVKRAF
jgi:type IV pilus assembly protein PilX